MEWYVNDLSIEGQFTTPQDFCERFAELLKLRMQYPLLQQGLFCSRQLSQRFVTHQHTMQQAIMQHPDRLFKQQALFWLAQKGPFWDDVRTPNENDYFEFQTEDVTDQGLGEAARACLVNKTVSVFSFIGNQRFDFAITPLTVQHDWSEPQLNNDGRDTSVF